MAESVGVGAQSTLPNDLNELLKTLIIDIRVLQFQLYEGISRGDDPAQIRAALKATTEVVYTQQ